MKRNLKVKMHAEGSRGGRGRSKLGWFETKNDLVESRFSDNYANVDQLLWYSAPVCLGTGHCLGAGP